MPALWTSVVGFSGAGKTPGLNVTLRVLAAIERDRKSKIAELKRAHDLRAETAKAAAKKWKKEVAAAVEEGRKGPEKPPEAIDPGEFTVPRLAVTDVTIERLAVLLQARPSGLAVICDELAGLFLNMGRYSNGSDREFWLRAWNGQPHIVERPGAAGDRARSSACRYDRRIPARQTGGLIQRRLRWYVRAHAVCVAR
jgi:hypothetical protein